MKRIRSAKKRAETLEEKIAVEVRLHQRYVDVETRIGELRDSGGYDGRRDKELAELEIELASIDAQIQEVG